jgi:F0F1-type ATP synthase assembly protein I
MTAHHRLDTVVDRPVPTFPDQVEVVALSDNSSDRSATAMFGALTGIATLSAALVVGGAGLGLLVDDKTGAPHVFVFLGLVLGIAAAVLATRSIIRRFFR